MASRLTNRTVGGETGSPSRSVSRFAIALVRYLSGVGDGGGSVGEHPVAVALHVERGLLGGELAVERGVQVGPDGVAELLDTGAGQEHVELAARGDLIHHHLEIR